MEKKLNFRASQPIKLDELIVYLNYITILLKQREIAMQKILLKIAVFVFLLIPQVWAAEDEETAENLESAYVSLGDPMVLNLSSNKSRLTFLQMKADILINDSDSEDEIKIHIPAIRHQLIVLLSEQPARDMKSSSKREEIRSIATAQVQELMTELGSSAQISDVLFSSFLVQ